MKQDSTQIKYNRWKPVIASITIQMCMGTAYIWSVFQSHLIKSNATPNALFDWPATNGTLAYSLLLFTLTIGSITGGKILARFRRPRPVIIIGGLVLGAGFILSMFTSETTPWILWLGYGILGGVGMGMAYTTTIATCQKWFPDKKGFVTGIIVAALGFGGLIFTPTAEALIGRLGVLDTFAVLGIIFILVSIISSIFIKEPHEGYKPDGWVPKTSSNGNASVSLSPSEVLRTSQFYMITLVMMCATAAGSMMIPMAKILGLQPESGLTKSAALAGVMIIAICNSSGRLFWGWISDKLGRKRTILILLAITAISIICVSFVTSYLLLLLIALIGFSYGGYLGVFPALTAEFWGSRYVATNYGMVLSGFGIGAVISSFTIAYLSAEKAFSTAFTIAAIAAAAGFIIMLLIKVPEIKN